MRDNSLETGVYRIINAVNGKFYIGSTSKSFKQRWRDHRLLLRGNRHHNRHLQYAWNKYGEQAFTFSIVERCIPEQCLEREQWWINNDNPLDPSTGYNIAPNAGSNLGIRYSEQVKKNMSAAQRNRSPEWRAKMSVIQKNRSPEWRAKLGAAHCGIRHSEEAKAKISASNSSRRPEVRAKMSAAARGKPKTAEHRANIAAALVGKKYSAERIAKRTATRKANRAAKLAGDGRG